MPGCNIIFVLVSLLEGIFQSCDDTLSSKSSEHSYCKIKSQISSLFMVYYSLNLLGTLVGPNKNIRTVKANWVSFAVAGLKKKDWSSSVWNPGQQGMSWDCGKDAVHHSFLGNTSSLNSYFLQESKFKKNFITCKSQPKRNREMQPVGFTSKHKLRWLSRHLLGLRGAPAELLPSALTTMRIGFHCKKGLNSLMPITIKRLKTV